MRGFCDSIFYLLFNLKIVLYFLSSTVHFKLSLEMIISLPETELTKKNVK